MSDLLKTKTAEALPARPIRARATEQHGSNSGAGSGAFSVYRRNRRSEMKRVQQMDEEQEIEEKNEIFYKKQIMNAELDQARLDKNRKKRRRKKANKKDGDHEDDEVDKQDEELTAEEKADLLRMAISESDEFGKEEKALGN